MTTANTTPTAAEQMIHQRLDAIDRALLGWLPRTERLALVAQVEARAQELGIADAVADGSVVGNSTCLELAAAPAPVVGSACRRRSAMALTAGILGIVALVLLFATPVSYLVAGFLGDVIGEVGAISLLGVHLGILTLGGLAAVALGTAALVQLKRRRGTLGGHAWAITGLCTGPWPLLGGAVVGIILGVELMGSMTMSATVSDASMSEEVPSPAQASYCAPATYAPGASGLPSPGCVPPVPMGVVAGGLVGSAQVVPSDPEYRPAPVARAPVGPDELPSRPAAPTYVPVEPPTDQAPPFEGPARPEPPAVP
jgi:hypothetical protein